MRNYQKFVAQVVATVLAALVPALADGKLSTAEWVNVGIIGLGAVAVLGAGNLPVGVWQHTKTIVSVATAVLVTIASFLTGGLSTTEWIQIGMAALGAVGVFAVPGPVQPVR